MQFEKGHLYHIYNQGNNRRKIFFKRENYLFFIKKIETQITPFADVLAWCLMPNHFHLMVRVNDVEVASGSATSSRTSTSLNQSIGILLASYTRAINEQNKSTGSLFRGKTKAQCLDGLDEIKSSFFSKHGITHINLSNSGKAYPQVCFNYIHANPTKAGLVEKDQHWEFSSAQDFAGLRNGTLINTELALKIIGLS